MRWTRRWLSLSGSQHGASGVVGSRHLRTRSARSNNTNGLKQRHKRMWTVEQHQAVQQAMTLALKGVNCLMTNHKDKDNVILRQFWDECALHCQMGSSSLANAGRGLFAARPVPQGTIITLYPAHFLGLEMESNHNSNDDLFHCRVFSSEADQVYFEQHDYESEAGNNLLVLQDHRKSLLPSLPQQQQQHQEAILHIDVNPQQPTTAAWLSHIINDGATTLSHREQDIMEYYRHTNARRNCFHVPLGPSPLMVTVTTRPVAEGDEFFTSYDFLYWVMDLVDNHVVTDNHMMITEAMDQEMDAMDAALQQATRSVMESNQYQPVIAEIHKVFEQTMH